MKTLFLASYFASVKDLLPAFLGGNLAGKKACFIPTAANPEKVRFYVDADRKALASLGLSVQDLDLAVESSGSVEDKLGNADIIFVSGGNSFYLLRELRRSSADRLLKALVEKGKPYVGSSAGSIVLSPDIEYASRMDDPGKAPGLEDYRGLGLVDFHTLPHRGAFPFKKIVEKTIELYGERLDLVPIGNDQAVLVKGGAREIASR